MRVHTRERSRKATNEWPSGQVDGETHWIVLPLETMAFACSLIDACSGERASLVVCGVIGRGFPLNTRALLPRVLPPSVPWAGVVTILRGCIGCAAGAVCRYRAAALASAGTDIEKR